MEDDAMGRIVVTEFVSLDGVFEDPGGSEGTKHAGWTFTFDRGADGDAFKLAELEAASSQLLGRVTYDGFAAAWPAMTDDGGFADKMNGMRKYVVSTTLHTADWSNSTIIRGNLADAIPAIKAEETGDILVAGSGTLVRALMAENLVDEIRLMVFPVVLGSGRRLFEDAATTRLTLAGSQQVGSDGVTILTYSRA
jgi:dihydrofolate reductase